MLKAKKLTEKKITDGRGLITSLEEANGIRWYGWSGVLCGDDGHALNEVLHFRIEGIVSHEVGGTWV